MKTLYLIVLTLLFSACACTHSSTTFLDVHTFEKTIQKKNVVLIDVRTPKEFAEGHLANALNIDYKNADFLDNIKQLDKNKEYLLYCRSGRRSAAALDEMTKLGFKKVYDLQGGIIAWEKEGKTIIK